MSLLGWITSRIGQDLDEQVHGSSGVARDRFEPTLDDAELVVRARLAADPPATITVRAEARPDAGDDAPMPVEQQGASAIELSLGAARPWRGGIVVVRAVANGPGAGELAVLSVELLQPNAEVVDGPPLAFQTYAVEGRRDDQGRAALELHVQLG